MAQGDSRYGFVDYVTGEAVPGVVVASKKRSKVLRDEPYMVTFLKALSNLSSDKDIGVGEYRVLHCLIGKVEMRNSWSVINHEQLASELGMRRQNVGRAMKTLLEKGIVIRGARMGKGYAYSLNPNFGWRGPIGELADARRRVADKKAGACADIAAEV